MSEATVTRRGLITIPAELRAALAVNPGDRVTFTLLDDGAALIRAKTRSLDGLQGLLKDAGNKRRKPVPTGDLNLR